MKSKELPNLWVKADRGDSGFDLELRSPEGDPDPENDPGSPPAAYPGRWVGEQKRQVIIIMKSKTRSQQKPPKSQALSGLNPGMRMKGGVRYDPTVNGFVAIVHTWDNVHCTGEPREWRTPQVFPTEEEAMQYYKTNIRPELEKMTSQLAKSSKNIIHRKR